MPGRALRIILPRTQKAVQVAAPELPASVLPKGLKVLLVEDNDQVREFAADLLRDLRCQVVPVEGGQQALDLALMDDFDLVFSDVVMPGISGLELAKTLAAERPGLPVLLATGYSAELVGDQSRRFKVVAKPYDARMLAGAIATVLEEPRQIA